MENNDYYTSTWPQCVSTWYASGGVIVEAREVTELRAVSEFKCCPHCGGTGCAACLWQGEYAVLRFKPVIVGYERGRTLTESEALASRGVALRYVTL